MDAAKTARLIEFFDQQTSALRAATGEDSPLGPVEKQVSKVANTFGCQSGNIANLMSIYLDRPITIPGNSRRLGEELFNIGTVIVVTRRGHGHNYPVNRPTIVTAPRRTNRMLTVMRTGEVRVGNNLERLREFIRPATREEITSIVTTLGDRLLDHIAII